MLFSLMTQQSGTNGNGDNGNGGLPDLSNREMLKILLDEIADVRRELKEDIQHVDRKLGGRMDGLETEMGSLKTEMGSLRTEMSSLRMEVHQNQITFLKNHEEHGKRLAVLEGKAGQ